MKYIVSTILVACMLTGSAFAVLDVKAAIDFGGTATDNSGIVSRVDPAQYETVDAYVVITDMSTLTDEGLKTCNFMLGLTPGTSLMTTFTNLLPGNLAIGSWDTGIALAATECMQGPFIQVAKLSVFYSGTPGSVTILPHPEWDTWVDDCYLIPDGQHYFCVANNGGIGMDPPAGDVGCDMNTPVDESSWGSIKAMYR